MTKQLFANEKVVSQYIGALLCEDEPDENLEPVAKLLAHVGQHVDEQKTVYAQEKREIVSQDVLVTPTQTEKLTNIPDVVAPKVSVNNTINQAANGSQNALLKSEEAYFEGEFQALFFEVAGLTLAVPLRALGGIHELGEVNHLFGKPKWFKGVMLHRDEKLNVVDTARWVMPEKYDNKLEASLNYQYLITLGDGKWGLLAEKLINNITLNKEDVKWRTDSGKRPWLAGVIKDKMCALIDVNNLNALLNKGLDSRHK